MKVQHRSFTRVLPAIIVALLASCGGGHDNGMAAYTPPPPAAPPPPTTPPPTTPPPTTPPPTTPPPTTPPPTTPPPTIETYVAVLNASTEVPPNPTAGTGSATVSYDSGTRLMTVSATTTGVPGVAGHVHEAPVGVNGPIIFHLTETSPGSGVWGTAVALNDAQLATLRAGNYYINIHTVVYPDGQIRGQINPSGQPPQPY